MPACVACGGAHTLATCPSPLLAQMMCSPSCSSVPMLLLALRSVDTLLARQSSCVHVVASPPAERGCHRGQSPSHATTRLQLRLEARRHGGYTAAPKAWCCIQPKAGQAFYEPRYGCPSPISKPRPTHPAFPLLLSAHQQRTSVMRHCPWSPCNKSVASVAQGRPCFVPAACNKTLASRQFVRSE